MAHRKESDRIRKQGYAASSGERLPGINIVAASIFDGNKEVVGAISIGGPEPKFTKRMAIGYGPLVRETAQKISWRLRYRDRSQNLIAVRRQGVNEGERSPRKRNKEKE